MFGKKRQPPIKSLIASGTAITGNLEFHDGLRVDGEVTGNISAAVDLPSMLVISSDARVIGQVRAGHVIINGHVVGPVIATELLELQPSARIEGDVTYAALEMHQGATINGQLHPLTSRVEELDLDKPTLKLAANNH